MDYVEYDQWEAQGSLDAAQRANQRLQFLLSNYQAPELDLERKEMLEEFVLRRKQELETKVFS